MRNEAHLCAESRIGAAVTDQRRSPIRGEVGGIEMFPRFAGGHGRIPAADEDARSEAVPLLDAGG